MTKEERQRQIDSLLKSMREDLPPPDADEVLKSWYLEMLLLNARRVAELQAEQEKEEQG